MVRGAGAILVSLEDGGRPLCWTASFRSSDCLRLLQEEMRNPVNLASALYAIHVNAASTVSGTSAAATPLSHCLLGSLRMIFGTETPGLPAENRKSRVLCAILLPAVTTTSRSTTSTGDLIASESWEDLPRAIADRFLAVRSTLKEPCTAIDLYRTFKQEMTSMVDAHFPPHVAGCADDPSNATTTAAGGAEGLGGSEATEKLKRMLEAAHFKAMG
jgi:hypothetical protein